ncbi:hypothetical protein FXO38_34100 [Capsicum annuum]|nr:hypothetical protein FXO38_34100 [Capsicum annuum]
MQVAPEAIRPRARLPGRHASRCPPRIAPQSRGALSSQGGYWPPVRLELAACLNTSPCRRMSRQVAVRPRPQGRRDYPLSLSISISGGKETYKDSLSNGERTGNNPALELGSSVVRIVVWRSVLSGGSRPSPLEGGASEGESPVVPEPCRTTRRCLRVGLFGNPAQIGQRMPSKAKYGRETDSEQVPRGKGAKDFEKRVKECLKLSGGKRMGAGDAPRSDVERRRIGPPIDSGHGPAWIGGAAKDRALDTLVERHCHAPNPIKADWHPLPVRLGRTNL